MRQRKSVEFMGWLVGQARPPYTVSGTPLMMDAIYVLATVAFFALMLAYVVGCNRLGRTADVERAAEELP